MGEQKKANIANKIYNGFSSIKERLEQFRDDHLKGPACGCSWVSSTGVFACKRAEKWLDLSIGLSRVDFEQHHETYRNLCNLTFEELNENLEETEEEEEKTFLQKQ